MSEEDVETKIGYLSVGAWNSFTLCTLSPANKYNIQNGTRFDPLYAKDKVTTTRLSART